VKARSLIRRGVVNGRQHIRYLLGRWPVLVHDGLMITLSWYLAYWLRYDLKVIPEEFFIWANTRLPLVIICYLATSAVLGVPRGAWRFTSIYDLSRLIQAVVFGTAIVAAFVLSWDRMAPVPRSIFFLQPILLLGFLSAPRIIYRMWHDRSSKENSSADMEKVLIVGAGTAGDMLIRDLCSRRPQRYQPVCLVDDDKTKHGSQVRGVRVIGGCNMIPPLAKKYEVNRVLLAMPSATAAQMRVAVSWCEEAHLPFQTLPKVQDIIDGAATSRDLREVDLDDLLGRKPVTLDWHLISSQLKNKKIIVTGAGGSIGSELCRQLAQLQPRQLILVDQGEFNLYSIVTELSESAGGLNLLALLGDVCDKVAMAHIFETHEPEIVFHAAAYKHVPLLENQAREAIRNNVIGTRSIAEASISAGCETFVLISTDKAVNPTSLMGATKRVAELICQAMHQEYGTRFVTVRFGNVLGSAGSVVPTFQKQISEGGPVTVTHADMTRYFMTMAEACQLILQASVAGDGQAIYVLNMGEPIKISDLAEQMIRLAGLRLGADISIEFTGLRPGEKLEEELFHDLESLSPTNFEKLLLAETREIDASSVIEKADRLAKACESYDDEVISGMLRSLVPEYNKNDSQ